MDNARQSARLYGRLLPLPALSGPHSGERIAEVIDEILKAFGVRPERVGYFVTDNASNNDTTIRHLAIAYDFNDIERRCRCAPHIINLVAQTMMFGIDKDAFENDTDKIVDETKFLKDWRQTGPLGTLCDIINYIKTPQLYEKLDEFQRQSHQPPDPDFRPKALIKPVKTRWNSYVKAFRRAIEIKDALDAFIQYYIEQHRMEFARMKSKRRNAREPEAPRWVKTGGLSSDDWQVIAQYIDFLKPLVDATSRVQGRGQSGSFGAAWEVIPTFESILALFEQQKVRVAGVNYNAAAPEPITIADDESTLPVFQALPLEDHYNININAAWAKLRKYWLKLDDCPAYFAATRLHPRFKQYCMNVWEDRQDWIAIMEGRMRKLWATYRDSGDSTSSPPRKKIKPMNDIDEIIDSHIGVDHTGAITTGDDEYERWIAIRPLPKGHKFAEDPFLYWRTHTHEFPRLSQLAFDVLSIPASSADCERMFSELGDLLEPRRLRMNPQLIAALQCTKSWQKRPWGRSNAPTLLIDVDKLMKQLEMDDD